MTHINVKTSSPQPVSFTHKHTHIDASNMHKNQNPFPENTKREREKEREREEERKKRETFLTTRGAFTTDFKVTILENPKPPNSITISVTGTTTRDLYIVQTSPYPTHLTQLFLAKHHHQLTFSLYPISHFSLSIKPKKERLIKICSLIKIKNKETNRHQPRKPFGEKSKKKSKISEKKSKKENGYLGLYGCRER